jgi:hypothetical protein
VVVPERPDVAAGRARLPRVGRGRVLVLLALDVVGVLEDGLDVGEAAEVEVDAGEVELLDEAPELEVVELAAGGVGGDAGGLLGLVVPVDDR